MRRSYTVYIITPMLIALFAASPGCSGIPKIIVLHDPLSADEHARLGRIYESQGKDELALAEYRAGVKKDENNIDLWRFLAELSYRRGDFKTAERGFEKTTVLQPENGDLYNNLAWVYIKQRRRFKKAEALTRKAMQLKPENRPYYQDTLGVALLGQGRVQEAVRALEEAVASIPRDRPVFLSEAYMHLSDAYLAAGDEARARDAALEADQNYVIIQKQ